MFTWICPQCGREVPPSYSECPNCAGKQQPAAAPPPPPPVNQPQTGAPAPAPVQPPTPQWAAPQPTAKSGMPTWFLSVLFALGFVVIGLVGFWAFRALSSRPQATAGAPPLESPRPAGAAAAQPHPMAKHIEITGLRLTEDAKQRASVQFVVVNHSAADLGDVAAQVNLVAVSAKNEREEVGTFAFKTSLGPHESHDLKAPVQTKLRVYELPDWQFLHAEFQITSPSP